MDRSTSELVQETAPVNTGPRKRSLTSRVLMIIGFVVLLVAVTVVIFILGFRVGFSPSSDKKPVTQDGDKTTSIPPEDSDKIGSPVSASKMGKYRFAAVSADAGPCSEVGTKILAHGGSAVDSAIASLLCIGVQHSQSAGIGGGFFMTIYDRATRQATTINARETAPAGSTENMFTKNSQKDASTFGGLAIAVPGEIKGYWEAHQRFGKLPWKDLFEPSIKMCRDGFKIDKELSYRIEQYGDVIKTQAGLSEMFTRDGKLLKEGDTVFLPKFGDTLERIANNGAKEFYNSSLSAIIAKEVQENGGIITTDDLANYKVDVKEPLTVPLGDGERTVYAVRPPSSGAVLAFILNILDHYKLNKESLKLENSVLTYHRIAEAFKFAFAKRTELGDENFLNETLPALLQNMTSPAFAEQIRKRITDDKTHDTDYYDPIYYTLDDHGTTHVSVLAPNGDAVSVTSTINTYFGSKVVGNVTGIMYNNEMDDFSSPNITNYFGLLPSPANFIKPGKRPLSSMSPLVVVNKDGDVELVVGASGGTRIITATAFVTLQTLWLGKNIKEAIDSRRLHHQLVPTYLMYEVGFPMFLRNGLAKKGHNMTEIAIDRSVVQGIHRMGEYIYANSDFRRGGWVDGF